MKTKLISGILIILVSAMTILILVKKQATTRVITVPKIYAISKTDETEYIKVSLLTNNSDSYLYNIDYIQHAKIIDDTSEKILPIDIQEIIKSDERYFFESQEYEVIHLLLKVIIESETLKEEIPNARLTINYSNNHAISLEIGSFNYMSMNYVNKDISLSNLYATHGEINGVDSVTGIFVELDNRSNHNIKIISIDTISSDVRFDNYHLKAVEDDPLISDTPASILTLETFSHFKEHAIYQSNILITPKQSKKLYVPLLYQSDIQYVYRFPLLITYIIHDEIKEMVIDDFPYINTAVFKQSLESEFIIYEIED